MKWRRKRNKWKEIRDQTKENKKKQNKQLYEHDILNRKIQNNNRTTKVREGEESKRFHLVQQALRYKTPK